MTTEQDRPKVRVVCKDCYFEKVVRNVNGKPAEVIVDHGREAGHKLTTEKLERAR